MQYNQLSFLEKRELLEKYRSDLRKIEFERNYLQSLTERLERELQIPSAPSKKAYSSTPTSKVSYTPRATSAPTTQDQKDRIRRYGFKLAKWDHLMLDILEGTTEPMNSGTMLELFEAYNDKLEKPLDDKQLRNALSRTVHKLANIKDVVIKETFSGKGFIYSLNPAY